MAVRRRLTDLGRQELRELVQELGARPFRGDQVFAWVLQKGVHDPSQMSNLPLALRQALAERLDCTAPRMVWERDPGSETEKLYLHVGPSEKEGVEAVLIMEGDRTTACLSSQVGCPVACGFCASGLFGLERNLTKGEILDQFLAIRARAQELGRRISNVVMMGMGEPLLNYNAVLGALEVLNAPEGGGIGARHLTISTIGLAKGVERLGNESHPYTLAFSLHAPDDATRDRLIPFPGKMTVREIADAARRHLEGTGREVTFEYVMLEGVNASPEHARSLAALLQGVRGTVNLIPYNENPGLGFRRPSPEVVERFATVLRRARIKVTVRKRKGNRILAACGQLRLRQLDAARSPR